MKFMIAGLFTLMFLSISALPVPSCYFQTQSSIDITPKDMTHEQVDPAVDHLIYKGNFVEVYAEKAIYHSSTRQNFLMKFLIKNLTDKKIGVDLSNYWKMIYPNQWGFSPKPYRETVDERQLMPDKTINKPELLKKFADSSLTIIEPHQTLEYFRDWNGSGEKVESKNKKDYLLISVDGQLFFTDGQDFEHLTLIDADDSKRVVVMECPIRHKTLPDKALIIDGQYGR